ncbi:MAG: phosphoglucosamine mutase [Arsenophonus sp.]|nr:MAG: phosphoglucosamine mutase [Arsenophonus sp.]
MSSKKYFGTDGIRGKVGKHPITPEFFLKLGWAVGKVLKKYGTNKIVIGKDTRISGYMLESSLEAGLSSAGLSIVFTGPLPTPAIAYLTRTYNVEAGIVISASHNPYYDNGIKFFWMNGMKLPDEIEREIEATIDQPIYCVDSVKLGRASRIIDAPGRYIEYCKSTFPSNQSLEKLKIVLDCANGSTYHIAPNVFTELGANVILIGCNPNGFNINKSCGTTNIDTLQKRVIKEKANIGLAFDGDGDRVIMVDHYGNRIDGDQILYIIVKNLLQNGCLHGGVVGTLMSNMGLEIELKKLKVPFMRANVGDRYILNKLKEKGWFYGGENSGHIILLDKNTTGDGIIASLEVLSIMIKNNKNLYKLSREMTLFPQILINVNYYHSDNPLNTNNILNVIKEVKKELKDNGRILLRKSGTEPLIRIMVEGKNKFQIKMIANRVSNIIKKLN